MVRKELFLLVDYDKPFKDLDEQLKLLELDRGLDLGPDKTLSGKYLLEIGYYSIINGYGEQFEDTSEEQKHYIAGTTFLDIFKQYNLDQALARAMIPGLLNIEQKLGTLLSYFIAESYGVNHYKSDDPKNLWPSDKSYLDESNYNFSNNSRGIIAELYDAIDDAKDNPLAYYRDEKNHIPPWILFSNIEFGKLTRMFKLLTPDLKLKICTKLLPKKFNQINTSHTIVTNMFQIFELVRSFRNQFAHNSRFCFTKFKRLSSTISIRNSLNFYPLISNSESFSGAGKGDLYNLLIIIILFSDGYEEAEVRIKLYDKIIKNQFNNNKNTTESSFDQKGYDAFIKSSGLPSNFNKRLIDFAYYLYK